MFGVIFGMLGAGAFARLEERGIMIIGTARTVSEARMLAEAGGDGVATLAHGASAAQMGAAFLVCEETLVADMYRAALQQTPGERTTLTRAFSGRHARGIVNEYIEAWSGHEDDILAFPVQNATTRPLRNVAGKPNDRRFLSMWAGKGAPLTREPMRAGDLVHELARDRRRPGAAALAPPGRPLPDGETASLLFQHGVRPMSCRASHPHPSD